MIPSEYLVLALTAYFRHENVVKVVYLQKLAYDQENRAFKTEWEEEFAFTGDGDRYMSLICRASLNSCKTRNVITNLP